jgi:hypothetical protein
MIILGLRTSTQEIRYAILDFRQDGSVELLNSESESRLKFPASCDSTEKKLWWFYQELESIVRKNQSIEKIMVKLSEYGGRDSISSRTVSYINGVIHTFAGKTGIPIDAKVYRKMETRRNEVKFFAESNVGKTKTNWNEQMADAVVVAFVGGKEK